MRRGLDVVYFDANAILDLFPVPATNLPDAENRRPDLFASYARRVIKQRVIQRRISIVASGILFQELARH